MTPARAFPPLRVGVLLLAGLESGLVLWLLLRAEPWEADWARRTSWESLGWFGLFLLPPGAALILAASGRGLGCALALVLLFAALAAAVAQIARVAVPLG